MAEIFSTDVNMTVADSGLRETVVIGLLRVKLKSYFY